MLCLGVLLTDRNHSKTLREILFDAVGKNRKVLGKPYGNGQRSVTYGQCSKDGILTPGNPSPIELELDPAAGTAIRI